MRTRHLSDASVLSERWRKSSFSNEEGGDCVEVADGIPGIVPVRDSKIPAGPALLVNAHAWQAFVTHVSR
ncbi:DUF397 domain-containing protein [Streptomyces sp. B6B3]|uniref:DUF397 domain-containing protein n=1 Tax=Streptomyces sp. B6B3 TaxID=3153570 RepID=UPI00325ECFF7